MRKANCISLIAAICLGIVPSAGAVALHFPASLARTEELPLIPLERSLIPWGQERSNLITKAGSNDLIFSHTLANALVRGLVVANRTGEIGYSASLSYKVQDVVRILRHGRPLTLASHRARVPSPVVARLLQLGNYSDRSMN
jgi:hypothetical protein